MHLYLLVPWPAAIHPIQLLWRKGKFIVPFLLFANTFSSQSKGRETWTRLFREHWSLAACQPCSTVLEQENESKREGPCLLGTDALSLFTAALPTSLTTTRLIRFPSYSYSYSRPFSFLIRAALTYACKCVAGLDGTSRHITPD